VDYKKGVTVVWGTLEWIVDKFCMNTLWLCRTQ